MFSILLALSKLPLEIQANNKLPNVPGPAGEPDPPDPMRANAIATLLLFFFCEIGIIFFDPWFVLERKILLWIFLILLRLTLQIQGTFTIINSHQDTRHFPLTRLFAPSDLRNGLAVEANALGGVDEVRRGEEAGAQPAAPQYGLEEGAGRPLALGKRHFMIKN